MATCAKNLAKMISTGMLGISSVFGAMLQGAKKIPTKGANHPGTLAQTMRNLSGFMFHSLAKL